MFEKALILCPKRYSIYNLLYSILIRLSSMTRGFDINESIGHDKLWLHAQMFRLPGKIRRRWESYFLRLANDSLLKEIREYQPDLVLVYNSEYLLPETCAAIRKRSKLVFYLGDSPFYTPHNNYFLTCLTYADLILSPDSFWTMQLNTLGLDRTQHFIPGIDESSYFRVDDTQIPDNIRSTEVLYVGACYLNSWGFKKAMLMSRFTGFDFSIYGNNAWKKWFEFFPELRPAYHETGYLDTKQVNLMFNRTKIVPVDGNPAILNGVHLRLMEALGSGALPLIEYRKDVDQLIFSGSGIDLPLMRSYDQAKENAAWWLEHEKERTGVVDAMRSFVLKEYSPEMNAGRLSERLGKG
jgi:glycosyltransferase involved in cell wall biosynthesis